MSVDSLVLSLRPAFADLIFDGSKRAELRRRFVEGAEDFDVFVYVTSPVRELRGGFRVERVWKGAPADLWQKVKDIAGVAKGEFDAYYRGKDVAYALKITDVWQFESPRNLAALRAQFGDFVVPQSWRYAKGGEVGWLQQQPKVSVRR